MTKFKLFQEIVSVTYVILMFECILDSYWYGVSIGVGL